MDAAARYGLHRSAPIPDDIPEFGISAGDGGCVVEVRDVGAGVLYVVLDRSGPELAVSALVDLEVLPATARRASWATRGSEDGWGRGRTGLRPFNARLT